MTSVQKLTPVVATTENQDNDNFSAWWWVTLVEYEIRILFWDTSSEEELQTERLQLNWQAMQDEPSSLQDPANMQIQINEKIPNFPS